MTPSLSVSVDTVLVSLHLPGLPPRRTSTLGRLLPGPDIPWVSFLALRSP